MNVEKHETVYLCEYLIIIGSNGRKRRGKGRGWDKEQPRALVADDWLNPQTKGGALCHCFCRERGRGSETAKENK